MVSLDYTALQSGEAVMPPMLLSARVWMRFRLLSVPLRLAAAADPPAADLAVLASAEILAAVSAVAAVHGAVGALVVA